MNAHSILFKHTWYASGDNATGLYAEEEQQAEAAAAVEREARLARVVDQLRRRLEQQQDENEQLEDLLRQADASLSGACPLLDLPCFRTAASCTELEQQRAKSEQFRTLMHESGNSNYLTSRCLISW